jgi:hypothetical protein
MYRPGHVYKLKLDRAALWESVQKFETAPAGVVPYVRGDVLLATEDPSRPVVIYRTVGEGEVIWVTRPEIASNNWIGRMDNHRLLLALIATAVGDGPLYFDEHIHGYVHQSPSAVWLLFNTTGGHLLLILALALVVLFMGAAVRPARFFPQPVPPRRQAAEMVLAQADLYRRAGSSKAAARQLVNGVKRTLAQVRHATPDAGHLPLVDALAAAKKQPSVMARDVDYLLDYIGSARALSNQELRQLARACDSVRRGVNVQSW